MDDKYISGTVGFWVEYHGKCRFDIKGTALTLNMNSTAFRGDLREHEIDY